MGIDDGGESGPPKPEGETSHIKQSHALPLVSIDNGGKNGLELGVGLVQIVVDDLVLELARVAVLELSVGHLQPLA